MWILRRGVEALSTTNKALPKTTIRQKSEDREHHQLPSQEECKAHLQQNSQMISKT